MMWMVKVTPHEPHPDYPKYYGPFSHGRYAHGFAGQFDKSQATAEPIEFARKPQPGSAGKRLAPYMIGYYPPDPKPPPPEQAEIEDA